MEAPSQTAAEIAEAPEKVAILLERENGNLRLIAHEIAMRAPTCFVTNARGTSDNAAWFFKYAAEIHSGMPVASIGPSVASIYGARLRLSGVVCLSVSQSGRSPDLVAAQAAANSSGAMTIAIVNDGNSPLAREANHVIPLHAGSELGIAATKSFICSVAALAALVAELCDDQALRGALARLPEHLCHAGTLDWSDASCELGRSKAMYVTGRGPGLAIASEAALKLKEMAAIHAEAISSAELMHGPIRLVRPSFPVLAFASADAARPGMLSVLEKLIALGANVYSVGTSLPMGHSLPAVATGHALTDTIAAAQSFYVFAEQLTRAMGLDPDNLPGLCKVTMTL